MTKLFRLLAILLFASVMPPALADDISSATGTRTIDNPVTNGDLRFGVNDAGVRKFGLTIDGPTQEAIFTGVLTAPLGTAAAPTYTFGGLSGMFGGGAGSVGFSAISILIASFDTTYWTFQRPVKAIAGSATDPGLVFSSDTNTGFYNDASDDNVKVATAGVLRFTIGTAAITSTLPISAPSLSLSTALPIASGGSNKSLTLSNGGILWTDADSFEVTSAGTASQWVLSGGAGAPTMSDTTTTAKMVDGSTDVVQFTVQGHSTQTALPFVVENSAGTDQFTVSNSGNIRTGDGSNSTPSHGFISDISGDVIGMYKNGTNRLAFAADSVIQMEIQNTGTTATDGFYLYDLPIKADIDATISPTILGGYSFDGDTDTGVIRHTTNTIGFVTGASVMAAINTIGLGIGSNLSPTSLLNTDTGTAWDTTTYSVVMVNNDPTSTQGNGVLIQAGASSSSSNILRLNNSAGTRVFSVGGTGIADLIVDTCSAGNVCSGTYTPTLSSITALDPTPVGDTFHWHRVGDVITMSGEIDTVRNDGFTSTSSFRITLPTVSGNFANQNEVSGVCVSAVQGGAGSGTNVAYYVRAVTGSQLAQVAGALDNFNTFHSLHCHITYTF